MEKDKYVKRHSESIKKHTPSSARILETDGEFRFELPFDIQFENLAYIGMVLHQTWDVSPHYHEHFELCLVEQGRGWFMIDDFLYHVQKGDMFLTKPMERHQGAAIGDSPFRLYYLGFQLEHMRSLEADYYNIGTQRVMSDKAKRINQNFGQIIDEIRYKTSHHIQMVQGLFLQMLVDVLRAYHEHPNKNDNPSSLSPIVKETLKILHNDESIDLDIEEIAQTIHHSRSHLDREFKRCMGISLGKYIRQLCIEKAKFHLRETFETVSSIAEKLNFPSIHSFSIFFKRHTGKAPQEYRYLFNRKSNLIDDENV